MRQAVTAGLTFGTAMGAFVGIQRHAPMAGLVAGVACAVLFGIAIALVARRAAAIDVPLESDEQLIHAGPANHVRGPEAVGGRLVLTTRRLAFRPHAVNVQREPASYPLATIAKVGVARTFGIVPNGLVVTLADGSRERFVVAGRSRWEKEISLHLHEGNATR